MNVRTRTIISIVLKLLTVVAVLGGLIGCFLDAGGFMGGSGLLLYFTNQSNIWIGTVALVLAVLQIVNLTKGKYGFNKKVYLIQQVFTVSISLTCIVYCFVLVPSFLAADTDLFNPFALTQMLLHVVSPLLAIVDFLFFTKGVKFKAVDSLWSAIPPLYYLGFSAVGFVLNGNFGMGNNFPYFFLNYSSPAGVFGFSNVMPYFMGSFYWIILLVLLVLGMSFGYLKIVNKLDKSR